MTATVSIIIPARDEQRSLRRTFASIERDRATEVIVVDGSSRDDTAELARGFSDRVVESAPGRARQLAAGAAVASGDVLLFLHADTRLAPRALSAVRAALRDPRTVGGAFAFRVDAEGAAFRLLSVLVNLRTRVLGLPYGDQAIFVRRSAFEAIGGFRPLEIMEDVDLVRRLRRHGRLRWIGLPVRTSDRRWRDNGVLRTTFVNLSAISMYALAVDPHKIRRFYDARLRSGRSSAPAARAE